MNTLIIRCFFQTLVVRLQGKREVFGLRYVIASTDTLVDLYLAIQKVGQEDDVFLREKGGDALLALRIMLENRATISPRLVDAPDHLFWSKFTRQYGIRVQVKKIVATLPEPVRVGDDVSPEHDSGSSGLQRR